MADAVSIAGTWDYRSYLNQPDHRPFGAGVFTFETPRFARLLRMTAGLVIQERPELPRPRRMLQLPQRLGLNLPNTLSGH